MNIYQESFQKRLEKFPILKERFTSILNIVENTSNSFYTADEVEQQVDTTVQQLGQDVIQSWAVEQEKKINNEIMNKQGVVCEKKTLLANNFWSNKYCRACF